jgi:small nuclear ribonucleoprotein (snRNP)-like protein
MVKLKKRIFRDELRRLCINKDWYTCGTVEQYDRLFNKLHDDMTEEEENTAYEYAMEKMLKIHPMYIKVKNNSNVGGKLKALREAYLQELKSE